MPDFPVIRNLLVSVFSVDVGLTETEEREALDRMLRDVTQRAEIEAELAALFRDNSISLQALLDNEEYVAYPADNEEDARSFITSKIWNHVFQTPPTQDRTLN